MVFSRGKMFLSDREIISFKRYNPPLHAKIGTNDVMVQNKLRHFQMSEKPTTANLINVIYKLMYL